MGSQRVVEKTDWEIDLTDDYHPRVTFDEPPDPPVPDWQVIVIWLVCAVITGLWLGFLAAVLW